MTDARAFIHAMLPVLDSPAEADARAVELDARLGEHRTETLTEGAALIENAACDADWDRPADYCRGLRAGAELLLAKTVEKAGVPAAATPDFFQVNHTYEREHHGAAITFKVSAVSTSPDGRFTVAHGWRLGPDFGWEPSDSDDFTGWTDVTEAGGE